MPEPKGERPSSEAAIFSDADVVPPVERWGPSHPKGIYAERGKPVCLRRSAETDLQREATDKRVWDLGESECRAAIVRIRAIARPEREQTSERSFITRKSENGVETGVHR